MRRLKKYVKSKSKKKSSKRSKKTRNIKSRQRRILRHERRRSKSKTRSIPLSKNQTFKLRTPLEFLQNIGLTLEPVQKEQDVCDENIRDIKTRSIDLSRIYMKNCLGKEDTSECFPIAKEFSNKIKIEAAALKTSCKNSSNLSNVEKKDIENWSLETESLFRQINACGENKKSSRECLDATMIEYLKKRRISPDNLETMLYKITGECNTNDYVVEDSRCIPKPPETALFSAVRATKTTTETTTETPSVSTINSFSSANRGHRTSSPPLKTLDDISRKEKKENFNPKEPRDEGVDEIEKQIQKTREIYGAGRKQREQNSYSSFRDSFRDRSLSSNIALSPGKSLSTNYQTQYSSNSAVPQDEAEESKGLERERAAGEAKTSPQTYIPLSQDVKNEAERIERERKSDVKHLKSESSKAPKNIGIKNLLSEISNPTSSLKRTKKNLPASKSSQSELNNEIKKGSKTLRKRSPIKPQPEKNIFKDQLLNTKGKLKTPTLRKFQKKEIPKEEPASMMGTMRNNMKEIRNATGNDYESDSEYEDSDWV